MFENERATYDYTRIRNFSALKYENECIHMMRPRFQFLRTSVRGVLVLLKRSSIMHGAVVLVLEHTYGRTGAGIVRVRVLKYSVLHEL